MVKKVMSMPPRSGKSITMPECPECNTPLIPVQDYGDIVVFYCNHCNKKVKAKRLANMAIGLSVNERGL